jgi:hypothetical protein
VNGVVRFEKVRSNAVQYPLDGFQREFQIVFQRLRISFSPGFRQYVVISELMFAAVPIEIQPPETKAALEAHISVRIIGGQLGEEIQMPPGLKTGSRENAGRLNSQSGGPLDQKRECEAQAVPRYKGRYASFLRECSQLLPESLEEVYFIVKCSGNGHRELWL